MQIGKYEITNSGRSWNLEDTSERKEVINKETKEKYIRKGELLSYGTLKWCIQCILREGDKDDINVAKMVMEALNGVLGANRDCGDTSMEAYRKSEKDFYGSCN